jgi:hypothetical protein
LDVRAGLSSWAEVRAARERVERSFMAYFILIALVF